MGEVTELQASDYRQISDTTAARAHTANVATYIQLASHHSNSKPQSKRLQCCQGMGGYHYDGEEFRRVYHTFNQLKVTTK